MHTTQFNRLLTLTARELVRTRGPWLVLALIAVAVALAEFAAELAVTEAHAQRVVIYAALVRLGLAAAVALVVAINLVRDYDDRLLELLLSRPLPREQWVLAKFIGYALGALGAALCAALPLAGWCGWEPALAWWISLTCELVIVVAAATAAALSLANAALASAAVAGFYVLARTSHAMVLLAQDAVHTAPSGLDELAAGALRAISLVVPDLATFAPGEWLVYGTPSIPVVMVQIAQTALFSALLLVAAVIDFKRRRSL